MINRKLFTALQRRFHGQVEVKNEGQSLVGDYHTDVVTGRTSLIVYAQGEEFRLSCPRCSDTRGRLFINHCWGVYDERTRSRNLWLANCYNEQCFADYANRQWLADELLNGCALTRSDLAAGKPGREAQKGVVKSPGATWRLDDIAVKSPEHAAAVYLRNRLLDPYVLGRDFAAAYCVESSFQVARHRIIAPIYYQGKLATWQARYIGDPPKGVEKWYTCPGTYKTHHIYNIERAAAYRTVALVEGPGDVWGVGLIGAGILGKSINERQVELLATHLQPDTVLAIVLDPTQDAKEKAKGKPHHIEKAYQAIRKHPQLAKLPVLRVYLPHSDPGSLDREFTRDLIRWYGRKEGLKVSFNKRL